MAREKLPELSRTEMAILATMAGQERYGLEIVNTLKGMGQSLSLAGAYTTLARLEAAGMVSGRWGDDNVAARRGARRRYYRITAVGRRALAESTAVVTRVLGIAGARLASAEGA